MKGVILLLAALLAAHLSLAGTTDDLIEVLKTDLKAEMKEGREKGDNRGYQSQELLMRLQRGDNSDDNDFSLVQTIDALSAISTSEKISSLCAEISSQLHKEQTQRDAATEEEMRKVFPENLRQALDAKTAKDVDAPLVAVGKLARERNNGRNVNAKLRTLLNEGQQLWEFLRQWQDYLAELDAGNPNEARQNLQNVIGSGRDFSSFIPRSELLARLNALQKKVVVPGAPIPTNQRYTPAESAAMLRATMEKCITLDDVVRTIATLSEESQGMANGSRGVDATLAGLRQLQRDYEEFQRGRSIRFSLTTSGYDDVDGRVGALKNQLLMLTLPRVLGIADDQGPARDETATTYLQGQLAKASAAGNWFQASRVFETAQTLNIQLAAASGDTSALRSFLAGVNQEKAKQYSLAVMSFQAALKTGSHVIPPETIGEHLADIKKASPTEFEQGMQLTLNPPLEPDSRYYPPGYPRGMPVRFSAPGGVAPVPATTDALTVPAKTAPKKEAEAPGEPTK